MNADRQEYCQCEQCGHIHKEELKNCKIIDDMYIDIWCPRCREIRAHLLCGNKEEDLYYYSDVTKDFRYYDYKTK